jgi:hypothetical protein
MNKWIAVVVLVVVCALPQPATHAQTGPPPKALRILLIVDSSSAVQTMLNPFRSAVGTFVDGLPASAEVMMVTTGGQFHVKVQPTLDHEKLRQAGKGFNSDGAANTLLETMIEADERFLRKGTERRPEIVIFTTDGRQAREEFAIDRYNQFLKSFVGRGGKAHGVVIRGRMNGAVTDIVRNLVENTGGYYDSIAAETALPDKVKQLVAVLSADSL